MEKENKKLRVFEMFAGYGGASFGLKKAGINHEVIGFSEIDKYADQCFKQNHQGENFGDCTKIDPKDLKDFDLLTGGFPCQSFSNAGKGLGELDTRGTLFNEIIRIAASKQPKYMLLENVKGLTTKKHKDTFNKILSELDRIGYNVKWKILNSKNYGIPQNRERVFFVCFRKDLEFNFEFPVEEELKLYLKDILEDNVDKSYYLTQDQLDKIVFWKAQEKPLETINNTVSKCLRARGQSDLYSGLQLIKQLNLSKESNNQQPFMQNRVYDSIGISPALCTINPSILIRNATSKGYLEAEINDCVSLEQPNSKTRRGRVQKQISNTLDCSDLRGVVTKDLCIRKLTPKECFRLMGFLDDNINLDNLSNRQLTKLAGNGWDINLVSKIFERMFSSR